MLIAKPNSRYIRVRDRKVREFFSGGADADFAAYMCHYCIHVSLPQNAYIGLCGASGELQFSNAFSFASVSGDQRKLKREISRDMDVDVVIYFLGCRWTCHWTPQIWGSSDRSNGTPKNK